MTTRERADEPEAPTDAPPMVTVYRHDVHKLRGRRHTAADETYAGVRVNEAVPLGADGDAALLSRPRGDPEQTVANHLSPARLSLLTGTTAVSDTTLPSRATIEAHIDPPDPAHLHAEWLTSAGAARLSESVYYPYTSLKYHTLLTAALLYQYRAGHGFADCSLVATSPDEAATQTTEAALASPVVTPHETVCWTPALALHITAEPGDRPSAPLGPQPARSFADVWSRLPEHTIDVDGERTWRMLDAQLRRIRAWSTALQYLEDYVDWQRRHAGGLP